MSWKKDTSKVKHVSKTVKRTSALHLNKYNEYYIITDDFVNFLEATQSIPVVDLLINERKSCLPKIINGGTFQFVL